MSDEQPKSTPEAARSNEQDSGSLYQTLTHLAIHGQENKWWMLYIYLVFNSILVLSCSTLIAGHPFLLVHQFVLSVFSLAGSAINICWLLMAQDYVRASNLYSNIARRAEGSFPEGVERPFEQRQGQRDVKSPLGTISFATTALPIVFIVVYVVLALLTWLPVRGNAIALCFA